MKYYQLLRVKGGAGVVARGFSIGLAIEMFTLPTAGAAFLFIFPIVYVLRANLASAMLGFLLGKLIYLPLSFIHNSMGKWILPQNTMTQVHNWIDILQNLFSMNLIWLENVLSLNLQLLVGGVIDGIILGVAVFFPIKKLLEHMASQRYEKRKLRNKLIH